MPKDTPALSSATSKSPVTALRHKTSAIKAILSWSKAVDSGEGSQRLRDHGKKYGISYRKLKTMILEDHQIQDTIFGPLTVEARMGIKQAVSRALEILSDPEGKPDQQIKWATFLAKFAGGAYEKQDRAMVNIGLLIPEVPRALDQVRVVDYKEVEDPRELMGD